MRQASLPILVACNDIVHTGLGLIHQVMIHPCCLQLYCLFQYALVWTLQVIQIRFLLAFYMYCGELEGLGPSICYQLGMHPSLLSYCGELEGLGPSFCYQLGMHPSLLSYLSGITSNWQK